MSKISVMYKTVKAMQAKELLKGNAKVEALKDNNRIFILEKEFERDMAKGIFKAKADMEMDCCGRKMKNQFSTEFDMKQCDKNHGFMHRMHHHKHAMAMRGFGQCDGKSEMRSGFHTLSALLGILDTIEVKELGEEGYTLSLNSENLPEDVQNTIKEKMREHGCAHQEHFANHENRMKELANLRDAKFEIIINISSDYEVKNVSAKLSGNHIDEDDSIHEMNVSFELKLS